MQKIAGFSADNPNAFYRDLVQSLEKSGGTYASATTETVASTVSEVFRRFFPEEFDPTRFPLPFTLSALSGVPEEIRGLVILRALQEFATREAAGSASRSRLGSSTIEDGVAHALEQFARMPEALEPGAVDNPVLNAFFTRFADANLTANCVAEVRPTHPDGQLVAQTRNGKFTGFVFNAGGKSYPIDKKLLAHWTVPEELNADLGFQRSVQLAADRMLAEPKSAITDQAASLRKALEREMEVQILLTGGHEAAEKLLGEGLAGKPLRGSVAQILDLLRALDLPFVRRGAQRP